MISPVYLADGREVRADVSLTDEVEQRGLALVDGRQVLVVMELPAIDYIFGYGEVVSIRLQSGQTLETVLSLEAYQKHVAYLWPEPQANATICLLDTTSGIWREMTDEEYAQERRAWDQDMKDMMQIEREWRAYRDVGAGE